MQNKASQLIKAARRKQVAEMRNTGAAIMTIAEALGCSVGTVWGDLNAMQKELNAAALSSMEALRERELALLDEAEREAWKGWHRSAKKRLSVQESYDAGGNLTGKHKAKLDQAFDSSFIRTITGISERRAALQGLDADKKINLVITEKKRIVNIIIPVLTNFCIAYQVPSEAIPKLAEVLQTALDSDGANIPKIEREVKPS